MTVHTCKDLRRFTDSQIREIRRDKRKLKWIALDYGVSAVAIFNIKHFVTYKDVLREAAPSEPVAEHPTHGKVAALALLFTAFFGAAAHAQAPVNFDFQAPLVALTAAGAGTINSQDYPNQYYKGLILGINIGAKTGTIAVTVNLQGKDIVSGQYYTLCSSASLSTAAFTTLIVYPGSTAASNTDCSYPLPATWRVQVVSGTGSTPAVTMTVGASLLQ